MELERIIENNRLGITIRKLHDLSADNIEEALSYIKAEHDSPIIDTDKKVIKEFTYNKARNEYYLFAIIDVPIKLKELIYEEGKYIIKDQQQNFARNIDALIRLDSSNIILLSQSQREVQRFSKYIREMTSGVFLPVSLKFSQKKLNDIIKRFDSIRHLKLAETGEGKKTITFKGKDLLSDNLVNTTLYDNDYLIYEIGGYLSLSSERSVKSYLNHKGRLIILSDCDKLIMDDLFDLIKDLEKMEAKE